MTNQYLEAGESIELIVWALVQNQASAASVMNYVFAGGDPVVTSDDDNPLCAGGTSDPVCVWTDLPGYAAAVFSSYIDTDQFSVCDASDADGGTIDPNG